MLNKSVKNFKPVYFLIAFGVFCAAFCIVVSLVNPMSRTIDVLKILSILLQILIGISVIIISHKITHKYFELFMGLIFIIWSVISFSTEVLLPVTVKEIWPFYGISAGIIMIIVGLMRYNGFKLGYAIPSITLIVMGLWYFLFSMNIIKMSFRFLAAILGPAFMVFIAVSLILFFFLQQRHKELVIEDDEMGAFSDEEPSFNSELDDED